MSNCIHGYRSNPRRYMVTGLGSNYGDCSFTSSSTALFQQTRWVAKMERRFEQYRMASGLSAKDDEIQASTLFYCVGAML